MTPYPAYTYPAASVELVINGVTFAGPDSGVTYIRVPDDADAWTTRDGRRMRLTEMTEGHLANAIALMERRLEGLHASSFSMKPGAEIRVTSSDGDACALFVWEPSVRRCQKALAKLRREDARRAEHGTTRCLAGARIAAGLAA